MKHLFFGGIHPKYKKEMSTKVTDLQTIIPTEVVIPMQQHIGAPCAPLVEVGQRVLRYQKIAARQKGLHQPQMLTLGIPGGKAVQSKGHAKENDGSNQQNQNQFFHLEAPPLLVPKRRMGV